MQERPIWTQGIAAAGAMMLAGVAAGSEPAMARPTQSGTEASGAVSPTMLIDRLAECRTLTADTQRLACFDRTVAAVVDARRRKDIVILDRTEVRKAKTSLFGFSLPSIKLFNGGGDEQPMKELVGTMRSSAVLTGGLIRFELAQQSDAARPADAKDNMSVWETVEQVMLPPRRGDTVTIKAGALGSYVATAPGRRSARVRRIR